jgi:flagellar assembly factor FliW
MSVATLEKVQATHMPVICFGTPLPGFPEDRHFVLRRIDEAGLLYELGSLETPGLRFLVVPPGPFFPDYSPEIDEETIEALGDTNPDNLVMLCVVTVGTTVQESTVNLLAPIIIDQETRKGAQLVLTQGDVGVREKLGRV